MSSVSIWPGQRKRVRIKRSRRLSLEEDRGCFSVSGELKPFSLLPLDLNPRTCLAAVAGPNVLIYGAAGLRRYANMLRKRAPDLSVTVALAPIDPSRRVRSFIPSCEAKVGPRLIGIYPQAKCVFVSASVLGAGLGRERIQLPVRCAPVSS